MDINEKAGRLYVVATPIGNLGDITLRALEALKSCDFVAAEDTRVTGSLLKHFDIKKPLVSYHEHNKYEKGGYITDRIAAGEVCALVSDAGTPAVSDPGTELVKACMERGLTVEPLPGACAAITAVSASGMDMSRFAFEGFLTVNRSGRRERLEEIRDERRPMIFYEAPHKLTRTLEDMLKAWGDRGLLICRELTKLYEEKTRTTLTEALEHYSSTPPKGEFVLIISPADRAEIEPSEPELPEGLGPRDAPELARRLGISRNEAYRLILRGKNGGSEETDEQR